MVGSIFTGNNPRPSIYGFKIQIARQWPKMQLSEDPRLMLPPDFRVEYNKWMAEFFGYTSIVKDGEVYKFGNTLIMNQTTYEAIKLAIPHVSNI